MRRLPVWSAEGSEFSADRAGKPLASGRFSCRTLRTFIALQNMLAAVPYREDRGGTAVEYGLIAALIAAVIAGTVAAVGTRVVTMFTNLANAF
jgi:pilus assembly protein Flp/PilA